MSSSSAAAARLARGSFSRSAAQLSAMTRTCAVRTTSVQSPPAWAYLFA